jgi:hypothetical protein
VQWLTQLPLLLPLRLLTAIQLQRVMGPAVSDPVDQGSIPQEAPADNTVPTVDQALRRLRIDEDLAEDVEDAIIQTKAEVEVYLDGTLYADPQALVDAQDARGIVCTPDIIAAQLLLIDVLVGANDVKAQQSKREAAYNMLRRHRNMGV